MAEYRNNRPAPVKPPKTSVVTALKTTIADDLVKRRFAEVLGDKAPQFLASITNVVGKSTQLKQCDPNSIMGAAFVAATYDLPIDSNLGFSAIVPFKNGRTGEYEAQFQLMKKGFIQLAIRSGQYEDMNVSAVYADELKNYNPITGECEFVDDFSKTSDRLSGDQNKIVGYYAWFKLRTGFRKGLYMSREELINHGQKYSQSYRNDLQYRKTTSLWSTNFNAMAEKTVLKRLLSHWGILSIQTMSIQDAIQTDQLVYTDMDTASYADNEEQVMVPAEAAAPAVQASDTPAIPDKGPALRPDLRPAAQKPAQGRTGRDRGNQEPQEQEEMPAEFAGFSQAAMQFADDELPFR